MSLLVYYDGECPFCNRYVKLLRLKESAGGVSLIDLRESPQQRQELIDQGFNLDLGMVVETDGRRVAGDDAVNMLAMLSTPSTFLNRVNKAVFSSPLLATLLYPLLRAGRWLTLFILGLGQIMPDDDGARARATIFGTLFSLFSFYHFFNYALEYMRFPPQIDMIAIAICAVALFFRPASSRLLFLLMLVSTVSAILQAPITSNHTMVRNMVLLGYWVSFFYTMIRGLKWSDIFTNFAPAGQGALLVMYVFGIFHKINTGFLNPETSCAVALWRQMPMPLNAIDIPAMHYLAIYGTFIVEGGIILMLFSRKLRHIGIVCGILFHTLLAFSNYAMYISFTTLSIALHCLFLNEESARNIRDSKMMTAFTKRMRDPVYILAAAILVALLFYVGMSRNYTLVTLMALPLIIPFCVNIIRHGSSTKPLLAKGHRVTPLIIGTIVTTLFFLNCTMPYWGLKSAQTINMFSNLRVEGGINNHLIMKHISAPFGYLDDVVTIEKAQGPQANITTDLDQHGMVYYDLLAHLSDNPNLVVTYTRDGKIYENMSAATLADDIQHTLHPAWFRKWFHFQRVNLKEPITCAY